MTSTQRRAVLRAAMPLMAGLALGILPGPAASRRAS